MTISRREMLKGAVVSAVALATGTAESQFTAPSAAGAKPDAKSRVENVTPTIDAIHAVSQATVASSQSSTLNKGKAAGRLIFGRAADAVTGGQTGRDVQTVTGASAGAAKKTYTPESEKAGAKKYLDEKIQPHLNKNEDTLVTFLSLPEAEKLDGRLSTSAKPLAIVNLDPTNDVVQKFYGEMLKTPLYVYPAGKGAAVQQTPVAISREVFDSKGTLEGSFHTQGSSLASAPKP